MDQILNFINTTGVEICWCIILVLLGYLLIQIIFGLIKKKVINAPGKDKTFIKFMIGLVHTALVVAWTIVVLRIIGVSTTNVVTFASVLSLGVSLALQDILSSLVNGLLVVTSKPFIEGEYVAIGSVEGTVTSISIFSTRLKTANGQMINVPNTTVASSNVINYSRYNIRRIVIDVPVSYNSDINVVKSLVVKIASNHEKVVKNPAPDCRLTNYGDSNLDFTLKCWTSINDYWDTLFDLNEQIYIALCENHISIDYNQIDIHVKDKYNTVNVNMKKGEEDHE